MPRNLCSQNLGHNTKSNFPKVQKSEQKQNDWWVYTFREDWGLGALKVLLFLSWSQVQPLWHAQGFYSGRCGKHPRSSWPGTLWQRHWETVNTEEPRRIPSLTPKTECKGWRQMVWAKTWPAFQEIEFAATNATDKENYLLKHMKQYSPKKCYRIHNPKVNIYYTQDIIQC